MLSNPLNPNPNANTNANHIDGIFRGIVEDNDDPLNLCRLRVRVPYLNGAPGTKNGIPTEGLPWAAACIPYAGPGYGEVLIPEVGSTVWVMFENNSKSKPVWIGCSYGATPRTGHREMKTVGKYTFVESGGEWSSYIKSEDTPYSFIDNNKDAKVIIRTPKGFEVIANEKDEHEYLEIIDRIGQVIKFNCPTYRQANANNDAVRYYGNAADGFDDGTAVAAAIDDQACIFISTCGKTHDPSYIKLSEDRTFITNGTGSVEIFGDMMTIDTGKVRSVYDGENGTFQVTNLPDSVFQMDGNANSIANGRSEVVVKDDVVEIDNGRVGIRLTDAIEFHGPMRFGNGSWGCDWDDGTFRIYGKRIKIATGKSSIILDNADITISADETRVASGTSAVDVGKSVLVSGDTRIADGTASMTVDDGIVTHVPTDPEDCPNHEQMVAKGDVSKGDTSIGDYGYDGWYLGGHIDIIPSQ